MSKLLTGYVVNFNRRHKRSGHLFQNRYKSIICEDDPYLLELTRYIHLNPLRAGLLDDIEKLTSYPWTGHATIAGTRRLDWQDTRAVLDCFGSNHEHAVAEYMAFVRAGLAQGRRAELVGGGLVRSTGGWSEVLSLRKRKIRLASDERILGSSTFVESLLRKLDQREKQTLRLSHIFPDLETLASRVAEDSQISAAELRSGGRSKKIVRARKVFCQLAVKHMGYSGADVARFLGVSTSAVNRAAQDAESADLNNYLAHR
jgi:hypothetical protein